MRLSAYGGTIIPISGSCDIYVQVPNSKKSQLITAKMVNTNGPAIIGNTTAQDLGLLKLNRSVQTDLNKCITNTQCNKHPYPLTREYLLKQCADVFTGIGCFPGAEYHIEVDTGVIPSAPAKESSGTSATSL